MAARRPALVIDLYPGFAEPLRAGPRPRMLPAPKARGRNLRAAMLTAALALVAIGSALAFRHAIVAAVPQLGGLYAAIGLPVNLHGVELRGVVAGIVYPGGWKRLRVEGEIANIVDRTVAVPTIELAILGPDGTELAAWQAAPTADGLAPGAAIPFVTEFADPPEGARRIVFRLAAGAPQTLAVR